MQLHILFLAFVLQSANSADTSLNEETAPRRLRALETPTIKSNTINGDADGDWDQTFPDYFGDVETTFRIVGGDPAPEGKYPFFAQGRGCG